MLSTDNDFVNNMNEVPPVFWLGNGHREVRPACNKLSDEVLVAVWLSGNALLSINEVNLR